MLFSILIPVFNVEIYLPKCLSSITQQTCIDFEVIIIDDGSKDKSLEICKNFAFNDKRFKIFHQENLGLVTTRNKLLSLSHGDWIVFIDSDDYIKEHYLSTFESAIKKNPKADAIICDYIRWEKNDVFKTVQAPFYSKQDYLKQLLGWRITNTALWAKAIKRTLIENTSQRFEEGIVLGEDLCFISRLFYFAKEIVYVPDALYIWNKTNGNSITALGLYTNNYIQLYETIVKFYSEQKDYENYKATLSNTIVRLMNLLFLYDKTKDFGSLPLSIDDAELLPLNRLRLKLINGGHFRMLSLLEKIERNVKKYLG